MLARTACCTSASGSWRSSVSSSASTEGRTRSTIERRLRDWLSVGRCSSSSVASMAPHCEWPSTTTSRVPKRSAANSTLPTCDGRDDVAGDADDEQVAEPLIEDDLGRHARVGAAEDDRERLLASSQLGPPGFGDELVSAPGVRREPSIPVPES